MIANDTITISNPGRKTTARFYLSEINYELDCGFLFFEAIVFLKRNKVIIFNDMFSNETLYIGSAFTLNGNKIKDIDFPKFDYRYKHVHCAYSWSVTNEHLLKIFFSTDSVMVRDFWIDYDIDSMSYGESGESR